MGGKGRGGDQGRWAEAGDQALDPDGGAGAEEVEVDVEKEMARTVLDERDEALGRASTKLGK